jgi:hypothetical protein
VILEHALLDVVPGEEANYENAFAQARSIIAGMPGFVSLRLERARPPSSGQGPDRHLEGFQSTVPRNHLLERLQVDAVDRRSLRRGSRQSV